jgi:6-phosphogluconolactonase (cycloisomerase 2 family)
MKYLDLFRPFGLRTTVALSLQEVIRSKPYWFRALPLAASFILLAAPLRAQFVYVTTYHSNTVLAYSIGSNGALTPVPGSPVATGNLPQSVTVDPSGRFAYVANWYDDNVSAYSIGSDGALTRYQDRLSKRWAGPYP